MMTDDEIAKNVEYWRRIGGGILTRLEVKGRVAMLVPPNPGAQDDDWVLLLDNGNELLSGIAPSPGETADDMRRVFERVFEGLRVLVPTDWRT